MKKLLCLFSIISLIGCGSSGGSTISTQPDPASPITDNKEFESFVEYEGSFRLPVTVGPGKWDELIEDAAEGIAFNPKNNSLFVVAHQFTQTVTEVSIPTLKKTDDYYSLNEGTILQTPTDPTDGKRRYTGKGGALISANYTEDLDNEYITGLLVVDNSLIGTVYSAYSYALDSDLSHFKSSTDLSIPDDVQTMLKVGETGAGFVSNYMAHVPTKYQQIIGSKYVTGMACKSIMSRTSFGPSLFGFNPETFVLDPNFVNPTTPLVYYPENNATLGGYWTKNQVYNMSVQINGAFFAKDSVIFVGRNGLGEPLYGSGTTDKNLHKQEKDGGAHIWVYDPVYPTVHGPHAYPYRYWFWAYSLTDLAKVKNGTAKPWEITPYKHGAFNIPMDKGTYVTGNLGGVANTPDGTRVFIVAQKADGNKPIVHVYRLK